MFKTIKKLYWAQNFLSCLIISIRYGLEIRWKENLTKEAFLGTRIRRDAKKKEGDNFSGSYLSVHFITSAMYGRCSRERSGWVGRLRTVPGD